MRNKRKDAHAFLSPSSYHWINYSRDKLLSVLENALAAEKGTRLHEFAADCISLRQHLPDNGETLSMYVNDCIDNGLKPEELLWFSDNCFGTADAISFQDGTLRIFDLKTGKTGDMKQLMIYAAIFCLEYDYDPRELTIELRLYKNQEAVIYIPEASEILDIMATIMEFDGLIEEYKKEVGV